MANDDNESINHLMHSVKSNEKAIANNKVFLKKIGIRLEPQWAPLIASHSALLQDSEYENKKVLDRFVSEIGFKWMTPLWLKGAIEVNGARIFMQQFHDIKQRNKANFGILECTFTVTVDQAVCQRELEFADSALIDVPIVSPIFDVSATEYTVTLWCEPRDHSFDSVVVDTNKMSAPLERYEIEQNEPLLFDSVLNVIPMDEDLGDNGVLHIQCSSDISVTVNGGVNADGVGLKDKELSDVYGRYVEQRINENTERMLLLTFGALMERDNSDDFEKWTVSEPDKRQVSMRTFSAALR